MFDPKTYAIDSAKFVEAFKPFTPEAFKASLERFPSFDATLATQKKAADALMRDAQAAADAWAKLVSNQVAIAEEALNGTFKAAAAPKAAKARA
ncbi:hypothetical protein [Amaricoccus solimangrovi]|uniref:Phasin domain-containing protein n=1 Tax=Amaricoccus solimangrovi TaxID=2589815 RepID=A0A501WFM3_9RHOB|nr:hypothetical protein [Amaricoccus solimangrovi]TPE46884.1 hypothetical protein FJM51_21065 [Amaricoccus solimangrovi]